MYNYIYIYIHRKCIYINPYATHSIDQLLYGCRCQYSLWYRGYFSLNNLAGSRGCEQLNGPLGNIGILTKLV